MNRLPQQHGDDAMHEVGEDGGGDVEVVEAEGDAGTEEGSVLSGEQGEMSESDQPIFSVGLAQLNVLMRKSRDLPLDDRMRLTYGPDFVQP
mmetsp:Transcript_32249/g.69670  ORF Transcript_32249/g.69670 Transcript_32249/m.69670 type:complete len:91 (-) Transcript_32249:776-1048(-)